jgi:tRNA nucleotidyltransferase/poly(A) polymerase
MCKILKADYPVRILRIMEKYSILSSIFLTEEKIRFDNLEIFYSIVKFINFDFGHIFAIALILSANKHVILNLNITKKERKFLSLMKKHELPSLSELAVKEKFFYIGDKEVVKALVLIHACNNYDNFFTVEQYLNFIDNMKSFDFDLRAEDLQKHGFTNRKEYGKLLSYAKQIFVQSNFVMTENDVLKKLETKNIDFIF